MLPALRERAGGKAGGGRKGAPCIPLIRNGQTVTLMDVKACGAIRHIWLTIPDRSPEALRNMILRMCWDGSEVPSVEVPLGDFLGLAHGRRHAHFGRQNPRRETGLRPARPGRGARAFPGLRDRRARPGPLPAGRGPDEVLPGRGRGLPHHPRHRERRLFRHRLGLYQTPYHGCTLLLQNDSFQYPLVSMCRCCARDPLCFRRSLTATIQQLGWKSPAGLFERSGDWCSLAYWYQLRPNRHWPPLPDRQARPAPPATLRPGLAPRPRKFGAGLACPAPRGAGGKPGRRLASILRNVRAGRARRTKQGGKP